MHRINIFFSVHPWHKKNQNNTATKISYCQNKKGSWKGALQLINLENKSDTYLELTPEIFSHKQLLSVG